MVSGVLAGALVVLPALVGAPGDGTFRAPLLVPHEYGPAVAIAAGDFDGDGMAELVLARGDSRLMLLRCAGKPLGAWSGVALPPVGEGSYALEAADLDGDGDDDLLVADPSTTVYVLVSEGNGSFEDPEPLPPIPGPRALALGDWNRDGTLDLATVNHPSPSVSVLLGEGNTSFRLSETLTVGAFHHNHDLVSLDYDGDGALDLLVAVDLTGIQPLRGLGDGRFEVQTEVRNLLAEPLHLLGADLDRDGRGDVIAAGRGLYSACVGLSAGQGTFERTALFEGTWVPPALADLDRDGREDLVLARGETRRVEIHGGDGTGRFPEPTTYAVALVDPTVVAPVDLDADGHQELVVADSGYEGLIVARGATTGTPLALGRAASGFQSVRGVAFGDLDGDGGLDLWVAQLEAAPTVVPAAALPGPASPEGAGSTPVGIQSSSPMVEIVVDDLDQDGTPDLAGTTAGALFLDGSVVVAFLRRDGRVQRELVVDRGLAPTALRCGHLDGDAILDLAVAFAGTDEISVALGLRGGSFSEPRRVPTVLSPRGLEVADVDGDGHVDLVAWSTTDVAVHFGAANGEFSPAQALAVGDVAGIRDVAVAEDQGKGRREVFVCDGLGGKVLSFVSWTDRRLFLDAVLRPGPRRLDSLNAVDLDGDGLLDLTVASPSERTVLVLENRGSGGLEVTRRYAVGNPLSHELADVNGDGAWDLVAVYSTEVVVFHGEAPQSREPAFLRGDVTADGEFNITDGLRLLHSLFLGTHELKCPDAGDLDDSGAVNLTDAILVLEHLFLGGRGPPPPHPACGPDPTPDELGCSSFEACP